MEQDEFDALVERARLGATNGEPNTTDATRLRYCDGCKMPLPSHLVGCRLVTGTSTLTERSTNKEAVVSQQNSELSIEHYRLIRELRMLAADCVTVPGGREAGWVAAAAGRAMMVAADEIADLRQRLENLEANATPEEDDMTTIGERHWSIEGIEHLDNAIQWLKDETGVLSLPGLEALRDNLRPFAEHARDVEGDRLVETKHFKTTGRIADSEGEQGTVGGG